MISIVLYLLENNNLMDNSIWSYSHSAAYKAESSYEEHVGKPHMKSELSASGWLDLHLEQHTMTLV